MPTTQIARPPALLALNAAERLVHDALASGRRFDEAAYNPAVVARLIQRGLAARRRDGQLVLTPRAPGWHLVHAREMRALAQEHCTIAWYLRAARRRRRFAAEVRLARFWHAAAIESARAARAALATSPAQP